MADKKLTYYQERMKLLGIDKSNNEVWVENPLAEHPMPSRFKVQKYSEDKDGNIVIEYWRLNRSQITWTHFTGAKSDEVTRPRHYYITRLHPDNISGDNKYKFPSLKAWNEKMPKETISPPPYIPIELVEAYEKGERFETLYLTEGAVKAEYASRKHKIKVVGLGSITHHTDKSTKGLHPDVIEIIEKCDVQKVVILWDGDCLNISKTALLRREELTKRPGGFYGTAKAIRNLIDKIKFKKTREKPRVIFMHPRSNQLPEYPKGLDDVLMAAEKADKIQLVLHGLKPGTKSPFFYKKDITNNLPGLLSYFGLKDFQVFYNMHREQIGETEFIFHGATCRWSNSKDEVEMTKPAWAKTLHYIGDEFFEDILTPKAGGNTERKLEKRSRSTLTDRFGKDFQEQIKYYHGFVNIPSHFEYEQIIDLKGKEFYNRYFPFGWVAKKGNWKHIEQLMKHIFGTHKVKCEHPSDETEYENWVLGLDYVQMLLLNPTLKLPVIVLYSEENNTGKSTFGHLLSDMFSDNVVTLGNSDFTSDFNEPYASALVAVCEETLLERRKDSERVKALSTNPRILVNPKGVRQFAIDFFCKFIFMSNNKRMIHLTKHDERYWILKVPQLTTDDPDFRAKMKAEIPAFIHYLKHRELATPRLGRMHFHNSLLKTEAFYQTVEVNEPSLATDLREEIRDVFMQNPDLNELRMPLKNIKEEFNITGNTNKRIGEILEDYLNVCLDKNPNTGQTKIVRGDYTLWKMQHGKLEQVTTHWRGRPYVFNRADFLKEDEIDPTSYAELRKADHAAARPGEALPTKEETRIIDIDAQLKQLGYAMKEVQEAPTEERALLRKFLQNRMTKLSNEKKELLAQNDALPF